MPESSGSAAIPSNWTIAGMAEDHEGLVPPDEARVEDARQDQCAPHRGEGETQAEHPNCCKYN